MRIWSVASGILEQGVDQVLLVANRRRNGSVDWSPPGGVIESGEAPELALSREVVEETGLVVERWSAPLYEIRVDFAEMQMDLTVLVYRALEWTGSFAFDDPDGIVHDADFLDIEGCRTRLEASPPWVADPILHWMTERWSDTRQYSYQVLGKRLESMKVIRHS